MLVNYSTKCPLINQSMTYATCTQLSLLHMIRN